MDRQTQNPMSGKHAGLNTYRSLISMLSWLPLHPFFSFSSGILLSRYPGKSTRHTVTHTLVGPGIRMECVGALLLHCPLYSIVPQTFPCTGRVNVFQLVFQTSRNNGLEKVRSTLSVTLQWRTYYYLWSLVLCHTILMDYYSHLLELLWGDLSRRSCERGALA